jgi:hypothetical protein
LNLLEGYFSVHDFSDREKIIFALLKAAPHVKDWWETYSEQEGEGEPSFCQPHPLGILSEMPSSKNIILVGSYEDKYIHQRLEKHLVLKYRSCLHRYIQEEMEFLDISSLGVAYRYAAKIEQKFK